MPDREVGGMVSALTRQMMGHRCPVGRRISAPDRPGERVHATNSPELTGRWTLFWLPTPLTIRSYRRPATMNDPRIDVLSDRQMLIDSSSEPAGEQQSAAPGTAPTIRIEPQPDPDARAGKVSLRQRFRRAIASRELNRLVRDAPTATIRNDLLTIAARNGRTGRSQR
jgi:hypothetical protein